MKSESYNQEQTRFDRTFTKSSRGFGFFNVIAIALTLFLVFFFFDYITKIGWLSQNQMDILALLGVIIVFVGIIAMFRR